MENLQSTMECVNQLNLVPDTYNRFQELVTACFSSVPVVPPVVLLKTQLLLLIPIIYIIYLWVFMVHHMVSME